MVLENLLEQAFDDLQIKPDQRESLKTYLTIIRNRDEATYKHCLRVGLLSRDIADYYGLDAKALLYAGLMHDVGKVLVDGDTLRKKENFTAEDYEKVKSHALVGHALLAGIHEFTAAIIVRHHRYQPNPYPAELPKPKAKFSPATMQLIDMYARLLSVADFYDAAISRDNSKFGGQINSENTEKIKELFRQHKPDDFATAEDLLRGGILNSSYVAQA